MPCVRRFAPKYFYPRSPCGERPSSAGVQGVTQQISIHALLAESDAKRWPSPTWTAYFYPRSPCGERLILHVPGVDFQTFLSTLSLRRATCWTGSSHTMRTYFYPRSPCGERLRPLPCPAAYGHFYPRSPCGERLPTLQPWHAPTRFLSTLSLRRATGSVRGISSGRAISIHALLAESDSLLCFMIHPL